MTADLHGPWSAIRRAPMVRMALPFVAGVLLAWGFSPQPLPALVLLGIFTISAAFVLLIPDLPFERWQRGAVQAGWFLALGLCWHVLRSPENDPHGLHGSAHAEGPWVVRVEAVNGGTTAVVRCDLRILGRQQDDSLIAAHGGALATLMRSSTEHDPVVGDVLLVAASVDRIDRNPDPGGFDRQQWAASRGIRHELFAPTGSWHRIGHRWQWTDLFRKHRERIGAWLEGSALRRSERAVVMALVLGERNDLDSAQRDAFVRSGTVHVLAVSGMHVGLIYIVLTFFTGWWGKSGLARWSRGIAVLLALWGYAGLTGASPSVMRATVMFSLFTVAGMAMQRSDNLNNLFAAALVLLVWDPTMLQQAGFQLSFLAVLGIILFYRPLERLWLPRWWWLGRIWSLAALSLAAQLLTTPVCLYLFKAFPIWFLPANLVVVAVTSLAVYVGIALIAFYKVPMIGDALTWVMSNLLRVVDVTTAFFASLPGAYPAVRVALADMVLLYALLFALAAWLAWRWRGAWHSALVALAALFAIWGLRASDRMTNDTFVIYDQRQGFMAGMVHGRELVVMASVDSLFVSDYTRLKLERHQRTAGIDSVLFIPSGAERLACAGQTCAGAGRWRSPRFDVLFVDGEADAAHIAHKHSAIVVHDARYLAQPTVDALLASTDRIVLAGGVANGLRRKLQTLAAGRGLTVHDVRAQGAFILEQ